jgi:hypothetical protein
MGKLHGLICIKKTSILAMKEYIHFYIGINL